MFFRCLNLRIRLRRKRWFSSHWKVWILYVKGNGTVLFQIYVLTLTLFGFFTFSTFRLDAAEQVEDPLTGLKVLEFDGSFIKLQLRTYIPKLDGLLGQHTNEPSELINVLLIHLKDKTTEITKVEVRTHLRVLSPTCLCLSFAWI